MLRSIGPGRSRLVARHRLGTPGLVYCLAHPEIELALATRPRGWLSTLFTPITPARHRWTGTQTRAIAPRPMLSPAN